MPCNALNEDRRPLRHDIAQRSIDVHLARLAPHLALEGRLGNGVEGLPYRQAFRSTLDNSSLPLEYRATTSTAHGGRSSKYHAEHKCILVFPLSFSRTSSETTNGDTGIGEPRLSKTILAMAGVNRAPRILPPITRGALVGLWSVMHGDECNSFRPFPIPQSFAF